MTAILQAVARDLPSLPPGPARPLRGPPQGSDRRGGQGLRRRWLQGDLDRRPDRGDGLAAGGIYHYIGSKENLLIAICDDLLAPLLEEAREIVAGDGPPEAQLRGLLRAWVAQVETHRAHMLVFAQERHLIEREPQWRAVRRQRKQFEELLDGILARGEADGSMAFEDRGLTLLALLGMVNYTPQWLRPTAASPPTRSPTATAS